MCVGYLIQSILNVLVLTMSIDHQNHGARSVPQAKQLGQDACVLDPGQILPYLIQN